MKKIKFTYEDVRNALIRDMRAKYGDVSRPIYEVYQYYTQFAGCGCAAANAVERAFSHDVDGVNVAIDTIFTKLETIKKLTNNLENIWGIVKLARHMHLIKNTIHFKQQ